MPVKRTQQRMTTTLVKRYAWLSYGVELAREYEYDGATGKLAAMRTLPVRELK